MLPDSLIEKAKNEKINPIARAKLFKRLISRFGLKTGEAAKRIGRSPSYISNTLRLLTLPEALKDALVSGLISAGHARALAAIVDQRKMISAYKQILRQDGSVRMAEALAQEAKKSAGKSKKKTDDVFKKMERKISQALDGAEVNLASSRVQTKISISFKGSNKKTKRWLRQIYCRLINPNLSKGQ